MTYDAIVEMLEEAGLPLAYDHFAEGESPDPPFLVFLFPSSDNFSADGIAYRALHRQEAAGCGTAAGNRAGQARHFL